MCATLSLHMRLKSSFCPLTVSSNTTCPTGGLRALGATTREVPAERLLRIPCYDRVHPTRISLRNSNGGAADLTGCARAYHPAAEDRGTARAAVRKGDICS